MFAFLAAGGGFFVYKTVLSPDPAIPVADAPGNGSIPGVDSHPPPPDPTRLQPLPGQPAAPEPHGKGTATDAKPKGEAAKPAGRGPQGTLTLAVLPHAKVFLGRQLLGEANPILTTRLPEGTHALTLVGDDGKRRPLSVKISASRPATFKLNLEDVQ